jgi:hypothetical protein
MLLMRCWGKQDKRRWGYAADWRDWWRGGGGRLRRGSIDDRNIIVLLVVLLIVVASTNTSFRMGSRFRIEREGDRNDQHRSSKRGLHSLRVLLRLAVLDIQPDGVGGGDPDTELTLLLDIFEAHGELANEGTG